MDDSKDHRVAEWYNATSGSYDELYATEQSLKHNVISEFLGDKTFKVLVDIGCGTGTFLHEQRRFYEYGVGIDLSGDMLKIAKRKGSSGTDLILASFHSLPIKDNTADCIVSVSSVKSDSILDEFIAEMERIVLRPATIAMSILRERSTIERAHLPKADLSLEISHRETIFCFRLNE